VIPAIITTVLETVIALAKAYTVNIEFKTKESVYLHNENLIKQDTELAVMAASITPDTAQSVMLEYDRLEQGRNRLCELIRSSGATISDSPTPRAIPVQGGSSNA